MSNPAPSWFSPKVVSSLGLGTVLAAFLVWEMVQMLQGSLPAIATQVDAVESKLDTYAAVDAVAHQKTEDALNGDLKLLRGICINTADGKPNLISNCNP